MSNCVFAKVLWILCISILSVKAFQSDNPVTDNSDQISSEEDDEDYDLLQPKPFSRPLMKLFPPALALQKKRESGCKHVCDDLPKDDAEPVCMMISRYKKGYQFFVNHCHARRTICKDNLLLHMVHPSRCMRTNTFFMPVS